MLVECVSICQVITLTGGSSCHVAHCCAAFVLIRKVDLLGQGSKQRRTPCVQVSCMQVLNKIISAPARY